MNYEFNLAEPPLLRDFGGNVLSVPADALTQSMGTANWENKNTTVVGPSMFGPFTTIIYTNSFIARRKRMWRLSQNPPVSHFSTDVELDVTLQTGYSETQKRSVETTLGVTAGAQGFGLSAEVKATLKMTDETTDAWSVERTTVTKRAFKASTTYCTWSLVDALYIQRTDSFEVQLDGKVEQAGVTGTKDDFVECILSIYEDKLPDPDQKAYVSLISLISKS